METTFQTTSCEQEAESQGELEVIYQDSDTKSQLRHFLIVADKRIELRFGGNAAPDLLSGSRIHMQGVRAGDELAVAQATGGTSTSNVELTEIDRQRQRWLHHVKL